LKEPDDEKLLYLTLTLTTILFAGCGIDSISLNTAPESQTTITSSQFVIYTGAKEIGVTLGFDARGDDVVARTTDFTKAQGTEVFREQSVVSAPGQRTGTVTFSANYAGFDAGTYTLSVFLSTNSVWNTSNTVTYIFTK
jgi:hypothetical protein